MLEPVELEEEFRRRQAKIHLFLIIFCLICAFQNGRINCQLHKQKKWKLQHTQKRRGENHFNIYVVYVYDLIL